MKMKQTLLSIVLLCTGILSANVQAHSEGHGDISAGEAARIAQTSAQMLTFKDHGLAIGKLDPSWNTVSSEHYRLDQENNRVFVITAVNPMNKDTLYFTVSKGGQLQSVTRKPEE